VDDVLPLAPAHRLPFRPVELEGHERIFLDYLATGVCVDGHPVEHLRDRLRRVGVLSSADLPDARDGDPVLVAGLVVARQHPQTANGTVFLLLEDEHGHINVIVPRSLYQEARETVNYSAFLLVRGKFEREGRVLNVVAKQFKRLESPVLVHSSHDFH
jgi:error-prone DNA polymerase